MAFCCLNPIFGCDHSSFEILRNKDSVRQLLERHPCIQAVRFYSSSFTTLRRYRDTMSLSLTRLHWENSRHPALSEEDISRKPRKEASAARLSLRTSIVFVHGTKRKYSRRSFTTFFSAHSNRTLVCCTVNRNLLELRKDVL